jgi:hypothetical protein
MTARTKNRWLARWAVLCGLGAALGHTHAQAPAASTPPRYADAMARELAAMGIIAKCSAEADTREHCTWSGRSAATRSDLTVHAVYSDDSDTVYVYVERYLMLAPEAPQTTATLRRLMELNWELLVGKFEWNPRTGEVRLSAVLNTDSNFDRRAFRSLVHALDSVAVRYYGELHGS